MLHPVILSGGSGRRLWPASQPHRPKPFLPLVGGRSTFIGALDRAAALPGARRTRIVAGLGHEAALLDALGGRVADLILEPEPRDTTAAVAAAALVISDEDPDAVLVCLPADHHIPDLAAFTDAIAEAISLAASGWIAILGLTPRLASPAYGYIRPAPTRAGHCLVAEFIEKPSPPRAEVLIGEHCLWNCGIVVSRADTLLGEIGRFAPRVLTAVGEAVTAALRGPGRVALGEAFADAPALSLDVAVLERTRVAAVVPAGFAWSDLGSWDAVLAASDRDEAGNSIDGAVVLEAASDCLVRASHGITVAVVGARNLAVIVDRDAVMICDMGAAEHLRSAIDRVTAAPR